MGVKELTCKYIVVVVDVVEFDPFIQDMKLICCQDLSLPVRVPWKKDRSQIKYIEFRLKIHW